MARQRQTRLVMGPCKVEIDRIVIREVQYQLEVNQCLVMGPCIVEIDRIAIRGVQDQLAIFWWVWSMWAGRPKIGRIVIREINILTKFHKDWMKIINILTKFHKGWMKTVTSAVYTNKLLTFLTSDDPNTIPTIKINILTKFHKDWMKTATSIFQGSSANRRTDEWTDGQTDINTISPLFLRKTWG
ncbi:hypothetical protein DPMN_034556 [Dreissena polymorpha]|uniref:Uncharacterized protein n=1 Tax=Dreissena polymorpha TaxID=45954 RepID=A0A9D4M5Q4_DREPO|nr:hypothetical protein DPMN_034556 [Dreissena polymorpha]